MTSLQRFRRCHEVTSGWEGGWSDHPDDPGGKTMYGITEAVYHEWLRKRGLAPRPVRNITRAEAESIYLDNYWVPCGGPTLHPGVDLATYDASVNSGVSRGRRWLLASIGGSDVQTVKNICAKRLSFVQALRTWATFGRGWLNRITDIEAKGVAWTVEPAFRPTVLREERDSAKETADSAAASGAVGGGSAGVGGTYAWVENGSVEVMIGLGVVGAGVGLFFLWQWYKNRKRRAAFTAELSRITDADVR